MKSASYETEVIGEGNHAALEIPNRILAELGTNKRAPLKITINGYTYQSTATGMNGKCLVVFPMRDREAAGVKAGDQITVTLQLDDGYREVEIPPALLAALQAHKLDKAFHDLTYSRRKEFARQVSEAKAEETRVRRIEKIISELK